VYDALSAAASGRGRQLMVESREEEDSNSGCSKSTAFYSMADEALGISEVAASPCFFETAAHAV
jgi:hypothetical protein